MNQLLYFDDLNVGDRWTSQSHTITESDVMRFAGLTRDFDRLHVDPDFARTTHFGRPVAHGLLGLSLLAGLSSTCPAVHTIAFTDIQDWKFEKPIFFGDTVHVVTEVASLRAKNPRRGRVTWHRQLINQHGEVTQRGVLETLVASSKARRKAA